MVNPAFFNVFAKNSLIKNIFEDDKKFGSIFGENSSVFGVFASR